jgi:hypothetical protein
MDEQYIKDNLKKNHEMEKERLRLLDKEYHKLWAQNQKNSYDALIKAGFTQKQAFAITLATLGGTHVESGGEE